MALFQARCSQNPRHEVCGDDRLDPGLRKGRCFVYVKGVRCPGTLVRFGPGSRKARAAA